LQNAIGRYRHNNRLITIIGKTADVCGLINRPFASVLHVLFQMVGDSEMQVSLAKPPTDSKVKEKRKLQHMLLLGRG